MYNEWQPIYTALAADILDSMGYREQTLEHTVRPSPASAGFVGPALTLDAFENTDPHPDPYQKIFAAYDVMKRGDVVVVATNGELRSGLWGELLATAAMARGVEAVVTDGLVRDVRLMDDMRFHCYSRGYSPLDSAGRIVVKDIQVPIYCAGVHIAPGDFMLADYEGIVVIPASIIDLVHSKCMDKLAGENTVRDALATGRTPREVFDEFGIL